MTNTTWAASLPAGAISAGRPVPTVHPRTRELVALRGTAGIIFGPLTLANPLLSLAILTLLLGVCALVDGGRTTVAALANRRSGEPRGALLATGLAELCAGIIVLAWPGVTAVVVLGTVRMGIALRRRRGRRHPPR